MKKVLYVATNDFNKLGGGSQAVRAYLDSIIDIFGKEMVDILIGSEYQLLDEYRDLNYIRISKRPKLISYYEILKGCVERWTIPLYKYLKHYYTKYDLVIINFSRSGVVVPLIKKLGLKVITIHHNEEVEYCMDNKNIYTFGGRCSYLINYAQKKAYLHSDINLFLTKQDKELLESMYGKNGKINKVIGVYDYKSAKIITPSTIKCDYHLGASGSLINYQTTHGIMDVKNNYLDIIASLIPDYKLLLTGRSPSQSIIDFAKENSKHVVIIPNPVDIISIIEKCSIYLCPTNIGGGLKLRAMDGLKAGMPILVHKVSARGYDAFWGKPYFKIYEDRNSFKKGLSELLDFISVSDVNIRNDISNAFYSQFGYQAGTERFRKILL